jgi:hypothetical protein
MLRCDSARYEADLSTYPKRTDDSLCQRMDGSKKVRPELVRPVPLRQCTPFVLVSKLNNEAPTNEDWFADFGEASKEAMKDGSDSLVIRERVG